MKKNKLSNLILLIAVLFPASCTTNTKSTEQAQDAKPTIAVVNYPLYYFAKSIGGDLVSVYLPAIGGEPSNWKPDAKQVIHFQNADLIIANGAGYAKWMEKVSLPSSKIVNTSNSFKDQWIETDEEIVHSHGPEGEHSHKGIANKTWIDFKLALKQAAEIHEALVLLMPDRKEILNKNFTQLKTALEKLDEKAESISGQLSGSVVIASHPVYQYLGAGYAINLVNMHWEPNEMPEDKAWEDFSRIVTSNDARYMIWEGAPVEAIRLKLESLGIHYSVFNVCDNKPSEGDFLSIMHQNLTDLEQFFDAL